MTHVRIPTSTPSSRCCASRWPRWRRWARRRSADTDERCRSAVLGPHRPGRRGGVVGAAVGPQRDRLRRHRRRQLRPVRHARRWSSVGVADDHVLVAGRRARRHAGRRVLRAGAVLDRRHDHDGDGERPAGHLHRARDPVAGGLRADRHPPRQRRRAPKRRSSTSCSARSRARSSSTASRSPTASPAARGSRRSGSYPVGAGAERQPDDPAGARAAAGRLRLQDLGGAVPHVDARRLRGRAGHRHRLHVHRRQGGGVCRVRARVPVGLRAVQRRLGAAGRRRWRRRR